MQQRVLSNTEKRVIKQLLEAIIFEKLLPFDVDKLNGKEVLVTIYGENIKFQSQGLQSSFGRIRLRGKTIRLLGKEDQQTMPTLIDIVNELTTTKGIQKNLMEELQQTVLLGDWNEIHIDSLNRRELTYEEMESAIIEGHPYHPCFKARTGFTSHDHQIYSPEARGSFQLWWIAVKQEHVKSSISKREDSFLIEEIGEETYKELLKRLELEGGQSEYYSLFPVHPWQWDNKLIHEVKRLNQKEIIPLGYAGDFYRATQSVRTLWNETNPLKAHIKLPLNMVNTSSLRLLETNSVCAAPAVSSWLGKVIESDSYLNERLTILPEYAGKVAMEFDKNLSGHIATLWRKSPRNFIKANEEAIPFNALSLIEEDKALYIQPWIDRFGLDKWLVQLITVAVVPIWHLLVSEGLALEAHAQNMILVHEHGWPKRIILRDFHESLEYVEEYLKQPELVPDFSKLHPSYKNAPSDKFYWMSSIEGLRELLMDTLFVFNLSELSYKLSLYLNYSEKTFWQLIGKTIQSHILTHPGLEEKNKLLESDNIEIYAESLFTKKIVLNVKEYRHPITNSLFHESELT